MPKIRHIKHRRFTRLTPELYREKVYRVVQDMLGYEEAGEPPDPELLAQQWQEIDADEREHELQEYIDEAMEQWDHDHNNPAPVLSEPYLQEISYAEMRRANIPPSGETRNALRYQIAQQRRERRLQGRYRALKVRAHEDRVLAMLDWLHADILDVGVADPEITHLVQSQHEFLRDAGRWLKGGLKGEGRWHLRMGGSAKFFHPAGEGQKIVDRELVRDDRPQWLKKMQESAMAEVGVRA